MYDHEPGPVRGKKRRKNDNWYYIITEMLKTYPNLYTDISFTMHDRTLMSLLKVTLKNEKLRSKIIFGTDFYVVEQERSERSYGIDLHGFLDEQDFWQIAGTNPRQFLKV